VNHQGPAYQQFLMKYFALSFRVRLRILSVFFLLQHIEVVMAIFQLFSSNVWLMVSKVDRAVGAHSQVSSPLPAVQVVGSVQDSALIYLIKTFHLLPLCSLFVPENIRKLNVLWRIKFLTNIF
jgi:hypothetical protein